MEHLTLHLLKWLKPEIIRKDTDEIKGTPEMLCPLIQDSISSLFPGFDRETAHLADPPILPNLKYLDLNGGEIHWALVKGRKLEVLHLSRPCWFMPDETPHEVSQSLVDFWFTSPSSILNPSSVQAEELRSFLAHFPSLRNMMVAIEDQSHDRQHTDTGFDITPEMHGSFAILLRALEPVETSLETLWVLSDTEEEDWIDYLPFFQPCEGFKKITSLISLTISYGVLFGPSDSQWSHIKPPLPHLLPASLKELQIYEPDISVLDWLARLTDYRDELPVLSQIYIRCSSTRGDSYEVFAFTSYPHPALAALRSIGVKYKVYCPIDGWKAAWNDYDLKALDLVAWVKTLGAPVLGKAHASRAL